MAEENKELTQQELSEQNRIRREKLAQMQEAGKDPFQIVKYDVTHHSDEIRANFDALENKDVCIAGRLMSKRIMGKASFCNIQDRNGLMQSYVSKNDIGEEDYAAFKKYDIGDIIGIKGFVFKTKTGEISVHAKEVVLLSKSLQVLPPHDAYYMQGDIQHNIAYQYAPKKDAVMTASIAYSSAASKVVATITDGNT